MALLQELDTGTPIRIGEPTVTLTIDGRAVSVPRGTSVMAAAALIDIADPEALRDRLARGLRLVPPVSGRDRGPQGHAGLLHDAGRRGHGRPHPDAAARQAAARRDGALYLRPSARLPDLLRQRRLRVADPGRRSSACATCATATRAPTTSTRRRTNSNPYFTFEPSKCIVCSRCVRACEEVQGTFALTILGRGFASKVSPGGTDFLSSECVSCGACVQACPTATLNEKPVIEQGDAGAQRRHHLRLLRRRLPFKAELKGDDGRAHGPLQGRQGQRGPFLRQGPLRLRLRHPQGPHAQADDPRRGSRTRGARSRGTRRSTTRPASSGASRRNTGATPSARSSSSRCTNEEVFLVQKLVRAGFGNNNVDTCARVCHSPTGYGL